MARRHHSPVIAVLVDGWDDGDRWGSAMSAAWAVAEVARAAGTAPEVDQILSVSWGMGGPIDLHEAADESNRDDPGDISFETHCLAAAYLDGAVTMRDLTFAARVLSRYIDICDRAGLSY